MRYEKPQPWPYRKRAKTYFFAFNKAPLKLEDKVLLGIAGIFLIGIVFFISFAGRIFGILENTQTEQRILSSQEQPKAQAKQQTLEDDLESSFDNSFKEAEEDFARLHQQFVENRKKSREAFQKAQENFKKRFQKAQANFGKRDWVDKFDKMVEQSQKETDRRFEEDHKRAGFTLR